MNSSDERYWNKIDNSERKKKAFSMITDLFEIGDIHVCFSLCLLLFCLWVFSFKFRSYMMKRTGQETLE